MIQKIGVVVGANARRESAVFFFASSFASSSPNECRLLRFQKTSSSFFASNRERKRDLSCLFFSRVSYLGFQNFGRERERGFFQVSFCMSRLQKKVRERESQGQFFLKKYLSLSAPLFQKGGKFYIYASIESNPPKKEKKF